MINWRLIIVSVLAGVIDSRYPVGWNLERYGDRSPSRGCKAALEAVAGSSRLFRERVSRDCVRPAMVSRGSRFRHLLKSVLAEVLIEGGGASNRFEPAVTEVYRLMKLSLRRWARESVIFSSLHS